MKFAIYEFHALKHLLPSCEEHSQWLSVYVCVCVYAMHITYLQILNCLMH